jgi:hypothetical protein
MVYDKYKSNYIIDSNYIEESTLERIQQEASVVSLHIPLTSETNGMVNDYWLRQFKNPIYLPESNWKKDADLLSKSVPHLKFYYLKLQNPEEMIVYKFFGDEVSWEKRNFCRLSLDILVKYNPQTKDNSFYYYEDIDNKEKERIKQRFQKVLLNKLGYKYKSIEMNEI